MELLLVVLFILGLSAISLNALWDEIRKRNAMYSKVYSLIFEEPATPANRSQLIALAKQLAEGQYQPLLVIDASKDMAPIYEDHVEIARKEYLDFLRAMWDLFHDHHPLTAQKKIEDLVAIPGFVRYMPVEMRSILTEWEKRYSDMALM